MPPDTTLADTLGGLGSSLANAWNPKTQWEAYELQQRILQEQFNYQVQQQKLAAQNHALQHYGKSLTPDQMGVIENMVRSGASAADVERQIAVMTGNYGPSITGPAQAQAYGEKSGAQRAEEEENAKRAQMGLGFKDVSSPTASDAEAAAVLANNARVLRTMGTTNPTDAQLSTAMPNLQQWQANRAAAQKGGEAEQTAGGTLRGGGTSDTRYFPPGAGPAPAGGAPALGSGGIGPLTWVPAGATSGPPAAAPEQPTKGIYATPKTSLRPLPGGGQILGPDPGAVTVATQTAGADAKTIDEARVQGLAAQETLQKSQQLRALADAVHSEGALGQFSAAAMERLRKAGVPGGITDAQTAQTAMNAIAGSMAEKSPAIDAAIKVSGGNVSGIPIPALNQILAPIDAQAQIAVERRNNALGVLAGEKNMDDFNAADTPLAASLKTRTQQNLQDYSVGNVPILTKPPPAAPVTAPPPVTPEKPVVAAPAQAPATPAPQEAPQAPPQPATPAPSVWGGAPQATVPGAWGAPTPAPAAATAPPVPPVPPPSGPPGPRNFVIVKGADGQYHEVEQP